MRIVMVGHKTLPAGAGGIDRHVEELAATLAGLGHEVIAVGFRDNDVDSELYVEASYRNITLRTVPSIRLKGAEALLGSLLAVLEAQRLSGRDGVVHLHGGAAALWAWIPRVMGRKVIVTVHALYWRERKWGRVGRWLLHQGERVAAKNASIVIAVSAPVSQWLSLRWGIEPIVIPSGVRAPVRRAARSNNFCASNPGPYILFCGRLIRDRHVEDLIAAIHLVEGCPPLVIVGPAEPSDTAYVDELKAMSLEDTVFLGEVPFDEVAELMADAKVMVNPSLVEGLSIAVLEAMAMRCPLILSDIPENRAAADECARYFVPKNPSSLADCLRSVLEQVDDTERMVGQGFQRTRDLFDWNVVAESVVGVYEGRDPL